LLSLIRKWLVQDQPKSIDLHGYGVIDCVLCHKYLRTGFALSLMTHLSQGHKMHEDLAISTATHMLELMQAEKSKIRQRNQQ
jgi:hypothetical protein